MRQTAAHSLSLLGAGCAAITAIAWNWQAAVIDPPFPADPTIQPPGDVRPVQAAIAPTAHESDAVAPAHWDRIVIGVEPASGTESDPEWLCYPRLTGELIRRLVLNPDQAATTPLLRSHTFNPRDAWMSLSWRTEVASVVATTAEAATVSAGTLAAAIEPEFSLARERGAVIPVDLRGSGALGLRAAGPDPFYQQTAEGLWAAPRSSMPKSSDLQQRHRALGRQLVADLAQVFHRAGTLSTAELESLLARAERVAGGQ